MHSTWTLEQILGLAPDRFIAKSSRSLAYAKKWNHLGRSNQLLWGDFTQINRDPLHAAVDMNGPAFYCSCRSRKSPCRHSLALLQLAIFHDGQFVDEDPPKWVKRWIKRASKAQQPQRVRQDAALTADELERLTALRKGMAELGIWLEDMIRSGLSKVAQRPKETWLRMSARLVDVQAGLLAMRINALQALVAKTKNDLWPELFLKECGLLYLISQGFERYDDLTPAQQADLRSAVGWLPKTFDQGTLADDWQVVGRKTSQIGRQYFYRTWLWGTQTNQPAMVARATHNRLGGASLLTTGKFFKGEMAFAQGAYPLIAEQMNQPKSSSGSPIKKLPIGLSILDSISNYKTAQSVNPWIGHFPFLLENVWPERIGSQWVIVDRSNYSLPLTKEGANIWHLLAISGGRPIKLFGEWNGKAFAPLALLRQGKWIDVHAMGGNIQ